MGTVYNASVDCSDYYTDQKEFITSISAFLNGYETVRVRVHKLQDMLTLYLALGLRLLLSLLSLTVHYKNRLSKVEKSADNRM